MEIRWLKPKKQIADENTIYVADSISVICNQNTGPIFHNNKNKI